MSLDGDRLSVRNPDSSLTAVDIRHKPSSGTSNAHAMCVQNSATSGRGQAMVVQSSNTSVPAVTILTVTGAVALVFGDESAADTNIYRSAADTLKTDDSLVVGTNLNVTGTTALSGVITATGSATTTDTYTAQVSGDSASRFVVNAGGTLEWGSGSGVVDTTLRRTSAAVLVTDGTFRSVQASAASTAFSGFVSGDSTSRFLARNDGQMSWGPGSGAVDTNLYRSAANTLATDDDLSIAVAGKGLKVAEGSNAKMGTLVLTGATPVVVSTTAVTATSRIFLTTNIPGGTPAWAYVSTRTAGTSFTVQGVALDTSTVAWMIVEPA